MELKYTILVIEDEPGIAEFMCEILKSNGFNVINAKKGNEGLTYAASHCPDIILLDMGLPDMDGIAVIKSIRKWSQVPIIVVSARALEVDKIVALDEGADDYLIKPFGTGELLARIRTAIRHANKTDGTYSERENKYIAKDLIIDFGKRTVMLNNKEVHLTQNEYKIISVLAQFSGKVITYDMLMKKVWGPYMDNDNKILRVNMANIRRKIEENPAEPQYVFTEIGVGYRIRENEAKDCI